MPDLSVSAVIPVYNGAAFLRRSVASVQRQSVPVDAILIVDDCSTDGSPALAEELAREDPRIVPMRMSVNGGPSAARNAALRAAQTSHVAFLDADDEWTPRHVEWLLEAIAAHPECRVAFDIARWIPVAATPGDEDSAPRRVTALPRLLRENFVVQSAVMLHRQTVLDAGGYRDDMRFGEDYDLWCRLALAGVGFVEAPRLGCLRTPHAGQASTRHAGRMYRSAWATRAGVIRTLHGGVDGIPADWLAALHGAVEEDLAGAWHSRRRDVVQEALAAVSWVPDPAGHVRRWERRVRYPAWGVWRTGALVWDAVPATLKQRLAALR